MIHKDKKCIIFGGNYFTDFLPPSKCWLVWDKENTGHFADVELAWTNFDKGSKLYKWLWNGLSRKGERDEELKTRIHPNSETCWVNETYFRRLLSGRRSGFRWVWRIRFYSYGV